MGTVRSVAAAPAAEVAVLRGSGILGGWLGTRVRMAAVVLAALAAPTAVGPSLALRRLPCGGWGWDLACSCTLALERSQGVEGTAVEYWASEVVTAAALRP